MFDSKGYEDYLRNISSAYALKFNSDITHKCTFSHPKKGYIYSLVYIHSLKLFVVGKLSLDEKDLECLSFFHSEKNARAFHKSIFDRLSGSK